MRSISLLALICVTSCAAQVESTGTTSSAVTHSDGFGHSWSDAAPAGTHDMAQAVTACETFAASQGAGPGTCAIVAPCLNPSNPGNSMTTTFGIQPANDVWAWVYAGPLAGSTVHITGGGSTIPSYMCLVSGVVLPAGRAQPPVSVAGSWN
jgi:hypothetical protein